MNKRRRYKAKRRRVVARLLDIYYRPWRNGYASMAAARKLYALGFFREQS